MTFDHCRKLGHALVTEFELAVVSAISSSITTWLDTRLPLCDVLDYVDIS